MPKIEGINEVRRAFQRRLDGVKAEGDASAVVGYTADYALFVHENLEAAHGQAYSVKYVKYHRRGEKKGQMVVQRGPEQQAKFLEQPARELKGELAGIIRETVKKTGSMAKGLLVAASRLLRASQDLVPVDTGALKASGFMALDVEEEQKAAEAYARFNALRTKKLAARKAKTAKRVERRRAKAARRKK